MSSAMLMLILVIMTLMVTVVGSLAKAISSFMSRSSKIDLELTLMEDGIKSERSLINEDLSDLFRDMRSLQRKKAYFQGGLEMVRSWFSKK